MTSPALVILTEPAHCELADANALLQALLQVQQLNNAGVKASQAFCDHPAEAMKFIDAYAKVYPELQLQSSDLPVPEDLYSIIADGRLNPLQAPGSRPDSAKLEEAGRLQPLYVLSLGTPEILMQALQDNRLVNNGIHVVEIAPGESLDTERLLVAETVAARTGASPSWLGKSSAELDADEPGLLPLEGQDNAPLKLESVELDLDRIEVDEKTVEPSASPTLVDIARAARIPVDAGADRPVQVKAPAASSETTAGDTAAPAAATGPVSEARPEASVSEQNSAQTALERDAAKRSERLADRDTNDPNLKAGDGNDDQTQPSAQETASPDELDPGAGEEVSDVPRTDPEAADAAKADDDTETSATDTTERGKGDTHSFSDPDDDVLYPPSGSFTLDDADLAYALPPAGDPEAGILDDYLGLLAGDDILDLEEIGRSLPHPGNHQNADDYHLDPALARPPGPGEQRSAGPITPPDTSPSHPAEGTEHDQSDDAIVTMLHDLDI